MKIRNDRHINQIHFYSISHYFAYSEFRSICILFLSHLVFYKIKNTTTFVLQINYLVKNIFILTSTEKLILTIAIRFWISLFYVFSKLGVILLWIASGILYLTHIHIPSTFVSCFNNFCFTSFDLFFNNVTKIFFKL